MISLTRRYRFCASHRLHSILLSDVQNEQVYGKCNNPHGHGHDYTLDVTASGPLDPIAGQLFPVAHLDRLVSEHVIARFDHKNVNADLVEFANLVPTTENMALVIAQLLQKYWAAYVHPASARLTRILVHETDRNSFEVMLPVAADNQFDAAVLEDHELEGKVVVHA